MSFAVSENPKLLSLTDRGLYCEVGDFYVDPWRSVDRAIITHAHSDHARWGMKNYLCSQDGEGVLRRRLSPDSHITSYAYGEKITLNGVRVSLHPAGHILGSAQVRMELDGEVAVVSGDYKTAADATCTPFEPILCHTFVTECTFGLPIYRWQPDEEIFADINGWWQENQAKGRCSILMGYALGKSQRALSGLDPTQGPIIVHGAVHAMNEAYREAGITLPETRRLGELPAGFDFAQAIVLAPPSVQGSTWLRRFGEVSCAFMSGWMAVRGAKRRRAMDRGFVLSDHVDWPSLLGAIEATRAERIWATHGYTNILVRHLREQGKWAEVLSTEWEGEQDASEGGAAEQEESA
jgi:putative mRNA 3-end processing factor